MKTATLTSRERVNRAMERRDHDRVPRHESFWGETINRWQDEGFNGDRDRVLDLLQTDFHGLNWLWPMAFPGRDEVVSFDKETRVVRDGNGKLVRYWRNKSGTPDHLGFDCDTPEKWNRAAKRSRSRPS